MSDMKRLFDGPLSTNAARILRSAETDAPSSPEVKQARIIEAYGLAPPVAPYAGIFRMRNLAALLGVLLVAGFVVRTQMTPGIAEPRPAIVTTATPPVAPLPPPASVQSVRVEDLPAAPEVVASAAAPLSPQAAPSGDDELAAIDKARAALTAGHPSETLERVAVCRKRFSRPHYREEADALEVQALAALGRRDEAHATGTRFLAAHPDSPYEKRIRAAIGEVQP